MMRCGIIHLILSLALHTATFMVYMLQIWAGTLSSQSIDLWDHIAREACEYTWYITGAQFFTRSLLKPTHCSEMAIAKCRTISAAEETTIRIHSSSSSSAPPSSSYWSAVRRAEGWRRPCRECGLYNRDHQITPRFKRLAHTPSKACDGAADDEANIEQVGAKHDTGYWSPHCYTVTTCDVFEDWFDKEQLRHRM